MGDLKTARDEARAAVLRYHAQLESMNEHAEAAIVWRAGFIIGLLEEPADD